MSPVAFGGNSLNGVNPQARRSFIGGEAARRNEKKRGNAGTVFMLVLIVAVVVVALGANSWKRDLPVSNVRAEGNTIVPTAEILRLAAIPKDTKLFSVDIAEVQKRVRQNPFIRAASVNRQGPEGISIAVEERTPVAILIMDQMLYIDEEGVVLPLLKSERLFDLPVLTGALPEAECIPGRRVTSASILEALHLLSISRVISDELFRRISEVQVSESGDLVIYSAEAGVPVLVGHGDLPTRLLKFDSFWRQIVERRGPQQLQQVDLRFEDQVVARWNAGLARRD
jgi:cell division protein FtsQ